MAQELPIAVEHLDHHFGSGELRKQILFDVSVELRSGQEGSIRVLGRELRGATPRDLEDVRRRIGYIFQSHNLIDALTSRQNVELSVRLDGASSPREVRERACSMLEAVGLSERIDHHPAQLSGGQRQRVAIARALAAQPRIILADEPTASLDKQSGRDVVDLMQGLAREQGVTVLLVTHDSRILDIADRIVHLEDGRLHSFTDAVVANTRQMMEGLVGTNRKGELKRVVEDMPQDRFVALLEEVTRESRQFLDAMQLSNSEGFESMLDQAVEAFTFKLSRILGCERASLFLVDAERGELWLKVAEEEGGKPVEVRMPMSAGIAGHVASTGDGVRVDDAYEDRRFNPQVDSETGFRTRSILCLPIRSADGRVFAVTQLLNRCDGNPFDESDELRFRDFASSIGVILETWWRMQHRRRAA